MEDVYTTRRYTLVYGFLLFLMVGKGLSCAAVLDFVSHARHEQRGWPVASSRRKSWEAWGRG